MTDRKNVSNFELLRWIRDSRASRGAARALLNALGLRANTKKGNVCWPSYRTLADDCQLDAATLQRAAKVLVKAGLITIRPRTNKSNLFFVNAPKLRDIAKTNLDADFEEREAVRTAAAALDANPYEDVGSMTVGDEPSEETEDDSANNWAPGGAR